jgi:putative NIF3 family GTP cyclohydrolase 1 type 2
MPQIKEITNVIEAFAPLRLQEEYDNAGFITGNALSECTGALLSLDCTEDVVKEAIEKNKDLILFLEM